MTTGHNEQSPAPKVAPARGAAWSGPGMGEFVALMAALMASNALAIDSMLPALPAIGAALDVAEENRRQMVVTAYLLGFGVAQLAYGPLADRFGRKRLIVGTCATYALCAAACGLAGSFTLLLAARFAMGLAAAASRVLVVAVVRDRFEGPVMARIMSLVTIVFMIVPVIAPSFGQAVLLVGTWRHIFIGLAVYALALALWSALRLPETLPRALRRPLDPRSIGRAMRETLTTRASIGNTITATLAFGGLFSFITSIQQIVFDTFGRPELIGLVFAMVAGPMALAAYLNASLVMKFGSRRLLRLALIAFIGVSALHLLVALSLGETLWSFVLLQAMAMACFSLIGPNAGALAMQPMGHIAGTASAVQGLISTMGAALLGAAVGQSFDGTTVPLEIGFTLYGIGALLAATWANRVPARRAMEPGSAE